MLAQGAALYREEGSFSGFQGQERPLQPDIHRRPGRRTESGLVRGNHECEGERGVKSCAKDPAKALGYKEKIG